MENSIVHLKDTMINIYEHIPKIVKVWVTFIFDIDLEDCEQLEDNAKEYFGGLCVWVALNPHQSIKEIYGKPFIFYKQHFL